MIALKDDAPPSTFQVPRTILRLQQALLFLAILTTTMDIYTLNASNSDPSNTSTTKFIRQNLGCSLILSLIYLYTVLWTFFFEDIIRALTPTLIMVVSVFLVCKNGGSLLTSLFFDPENEENNKYPLVMIHLGLGVMSLVESFLEAIARGQFLAEQKERAKMEMVKAKNLGQGNHSGSAAAVNAGATSYGSVGREGF